LTKSEPAFLRHLHWRDLLISASFANLAFLRVWHDLLYFKPYAEFWMKRPPAPALLFGVMLDVAALALLLWGAIFWARRYLDGRYAVWGRRLFILPLIFPLNAVLQIVMVSSATLIWKAPVELGPRRFAAFCLVVVITFALALIPWPKQIARGAALFLILLSPALAATFGRAIYRASVPAPADFADRPSAPRIPGTVSRPHLLWMIFDELDYRLAFVDRDPTVQLPELDRLKSEAFFATHAFPPSRRTPTSLPMLLTGTHIDDVIPVGHASLLLKPADGSPPFPLDSAETVFSAARRMGLNSALVGWYLPYGRILGGQVNSCFWTPAAFTIRNSADWHSLPAAMRDEARTLFETGLLYSALGKSLLATAHARDYHEMFAATQTALGNSDNNLVFVHFGIPHFPFFYNRFKGDDSGGLRTIDGYLDQLVLVDRTFGALRRQMEANGTWNGTTVLLTSDHFYRSAQALDGNSDSRIPFLLKLPGQTAPLVYDRPFGTISSKALLLAIASGTVATPQDVAAWLDRNGAPGIPLR